MRRTLALLAVSLTTVLGACGFQPVYAPGASARKLGNITIPEIEGRTGFLLRQELQKRVAAGATDPGAPARTLFLTLKEDLLPVVSRIDGFASRSDLSGTVVYYLSPVKPGDKPISGFLVVSVGLNQEGAPFGDVALQSDAEERLAVAIAERLHAEILLKSAAPKP